MTKSFKCRFIASLASGVMLAGVGLVANAATGTTSSQLSAGNERVSATPRPMLPDPLLLDGSTQLPEKNREFGMIGEFELPGEY